jgi:hypothetical protein
MKCEEHVTSVKEIKNAYNTLVIKSYLKKLQLSDSIIDGTIILQWDLERKCVFT